METLSLDVDQHCSAHLLRFMVVGEGDGFAISITDDAPRITDVGHEQTTAVYKTH